MSNYSKECNDDFKDFPVTVELDGQVLTIKAPPIFGRKDPTGEYESADLRLAAYVEDAIDKWELEHSRINLRQGDPLYDYSEFLLVVTRRAYHYHGNISRNDTFRYRSVQDVICSSLIIGDEPQYLTLVSRFESVNDPADACTEFKIGKAENLYRELAWEAYYTSKEKRLNDADDDLCPW